MALESARGLSVLWATDGSEASRAAIPLLRWLVLPSTQKLSVLSVAPHSFATGARPDPAFLTRITPAARRRALLDSEHQAQQSATELDPAGVEVEALARWGNPIEQILRAARGQTADLIVMGAKGHSNLGLIVLGSVTQGVVQHATIPVLIARPSPSQSQASRLRRVLVGFDDTPHARKAVTYLDRLNLSGETTIRLVRVVETFGVPSGTPIGYRRRAMQEATQINERLHEEAQRSLESLAEKLRSNGRTVETDVLHGPAGPALDDAARKADVDLIVVGSRKPSPKRHYLLGTTAEKLVRHSHVSTLIVR